MAKGARKSVSYGKIAGAVSGRSLAMIDPTIATRRAYAKEQANERVNLALAGMIGSVAGGVSSLASSVESNIESWKDLESGAAAVGGKEAAGIDFTGTGAKGAWKRWTSSAPAGGQFTVGGKVFSGTELSGIGKAVQGGYGQTIAPSGKSLFEAYGGTLKEGMDEFGMGWSEKGFGIGSEDIKNWGSAYEKNKDFTNPFQVDKSPGFDQ